MNDHYSAALLESALTGQLPQDEEQRLHQHLEQCPQCSEALEQMAGGPTWCREAAALLTEDAIDADVPTHEHWSEIDFTVEHLEPADEPNVLGRLGGYDVLEVIGRGGMGVVLKALDRDLKRLVAIKVLAPHLAQSPLAKKRFAREAQAAAAVVHSNVLAIHQVQPLGRLPFLVMPLVAGESLAERLAAQGTLELKEILRISMQAAAGLAAAHEQGLVHRDVKPANILLEHGIERAVLTDFGLARAADDVTLTRWGIVAGTPQYMSPEQARGEPLDGRSDLFSLGCVLYEMATGISPFRADSMLATMRRLVDEAPQAMDSLNPELPPWFVAIVEKLLEKDPARRFTSAAEVSQLLERCLAHLQQPTNVPLPEGLPAETATKRTNRGSGIGRKPFRWIGGIVALLLVTIGAVGAFLFATGDPPDIAGEWTGEGWGHVVLKQTTPAEYTGTYTDVFGKQPGKIEVKWSRIERRYLGSWGEGKDRFGELSFRTFGDDIRGEYDADLQSKFKPGDPHLATLTWKKIGANPANGDEQRQTVETVWEFDRAKYAQLNRAGLDLGREVLRLADGEVISVPQKFSFLKPTSGSMPLDEQRQWLEQKKPNVAFDYDPKTREWELKLRNLHYCEISHFDFQSMTADQFHERLSKYQWKSTADGDSNDQKNGFQSWKFLDPVALAFQTADGQYGILGIISSTSTTTEIDGKKVKSIIDIMLRVRWLRESQKSSSDQRASDGKASAKDNGNAVATGWAFKPEISRTMITTSRKLANDALRLSDGHLFNLPKNTSAQKESDLPREEFEKWLSETGVNFAIDYQNQSDQWEMKLRNVKFAQLPDENWKTLTADELQEQFSRLKWTTPENREAQQKESGFYSLKFGSGFTPPLTFAFETSEGHRGIFEFFASSHRNIDEAWIRFKELHRKEGSSTIGSGGEKARKSPSDLTANSRSLAFGPLIERRLNDISIGSSNSALDLTTGERLSPDGREFENAKTWAEANGADIIACSDGGGRGLRIIGGVAVKPADWYASPTEVSEVVANMERGIEKYKRDIPGFQDPRATGFSNLWFAGTEESSTYYIKTRNGTLGVLQINRLKDYPRCVEFRYKLLRPAPLKDEKPNDTSGGIHTDVGKEKPITEVVRQFNTRAEWDPIGKNQPPLSEDELRGAIYALTHDENDRFSTDEKQELEKSAASGVLPKDWQLEVFTKIGGTGGERFQGWMIYLSKHRPDSKQGFLVRQQLLCPLDDAGNPASLPEITKSNQADEGATPLAAAINEFNSAHNTVWNVRQKPLTEEEVVAAIRWWKTRRNDAPVTNGEFAQFQKIADSRELPKGAELEVIPDFTYGDGTEHFIWSVRIRMPRDYKPGWTYWSYAYEIRWQYVHSEGIDDVKRKVQTIAWGPVAENGLQAGVRFEPYNETYTTGQQVIPVFYYRNTSKAAIQASFPRLMTHSYYKKIIAVDKNDKPIAIDQDPNPTGPVGWIEEPLQPGAQHEIKGLPILQGDVDRGAAETVVRAEAGQSLRIHFELSNVGQDHRASISTGEVLLSIAGTTPEAEPADEPMPSSQATPQ